MVMAIPLLANQDLTLMLIGRAVFGLIPLWFCGVFGFCSLYAIQYISDL